MIPESMTEEPAQNGHEFFTCGELLSDSAPKLSATMQQPRISCNSPSDNSGRAGSSAEPGAAAAAAAARREESAGGAVSTPAAAAVAAQRGRAGGCNAARGQRGRSGGSGGSWAAAAAAPGPPACGPPESPATGQQEPGSTTGRDMDWRGRERPVAAGRGRGAELRASSEAEGEGRKCARPNHLLLPPPPPLPRLQTAAPTCQPAGPPPVARARPTPTRAHPRALALRGAGSVWRPAELVLAPGTPRKVPCPNF